MRNRLAIAGCTLALVLAGVLGVGRLGAQSKDEKADKGTKPPIDVDRPRIVLIEDVTLACDRPGILDFIGPREGDSVVEGQLVAGLQEDVAKATLAVAAEEAESDVDVRYSEKAGLVAQAEYEKALEANKKYSETIPKVEVLRLKLAWDKTVLEAEAARHRLKVNGLKRDEAQAQLETYRVKSPLSGIVTRVHRHKGEAVRQGDPILEVVNTKRVRVVGNVDIQHVWNIKPGAEAQVQLDFPNLTLDIEKQVFKGKVVFVDVKAEPAFHKVEVWAEVENPDNVLRDGLPAKMKIFPAAP